MSKVSTHAALLLGVLPLALSFVQPARADAACTDDELTRLIQPTVDTINSHENNGVCGSANDGVLLFSTSLGLLERCDKDTPALRKMRASFREHLNEARQEQASACSQ
ncbi:hypothetical protein [Mesorhizobium sp. M0589]|uniref:hypothetical protein n=1 Tax=Mesorhizobium sp. M0589 TaxID=2956965 RepID=UPI00333A4175